MRSIKSLGVLLVIILLYGMVLCLNAQERTAAGNETVKEETDVSAEEPPAEEEDGKEEEGGTVLRSGSYVDIDPIPLRGFMPGYDQLSDPIDNIDIATGKLNLTIPLGSLPNGRGGIGYNLNLYYESNIYEMDPIYEELPGYDGNGIPYPPHEIASLRMPFISGGRVGWRYSEDSSYSIISDSIPVTYTTSYNDPQCYSGIAEYTRKRIHLPNGTTPILKLYSGGGVIWPSHPDGFYGFYDICAQKHLNWPALPSNPTWYTDDGTYIYEDANGFYFPDGRRIVGAGYGPTFKEYDANGNYIQHETIGFSTTYVSNAAGQEIVIARDTSTSGNWKRDTVTIPSANGNIVYSIDWEQITVGGNGATYIDHTYPAADTFHTHPYPALNLSFWVIRFIQLPFENHVSLSVIASSPNPSLVVPEHNSYEFKYGGGEYYCGSGGAGSGWWASCQNQISTTMGLLDYMRTPSGSEYYYVYDYNAIDSPFGDVETIVKGAYVKTKTVTHDNGAPLNWVFDRDTTWSNIPVSVTITNPDGGKTVHHYGSMYPIRPFKIEYFDENETMIRERKLSWSANTWISSEIESVFDVSGSNGKSAITTYDRDLNGNLLNKTEYEWVLHGIEVGSTIKRKTTYDYYIPLGTDFKAPLSTSLWPAGGPRRLDALQRVTVYEGSVTAKAATEYVYDNAYTKGNVLSERHWNSVLSPTLPTTVGSLTSLNAQVFTYSYDTYGNLTNAYEPSVGAAGAPHTLITYDSTGSRVIKVETGYGTNEKRTVQYDWYNNGAALWAKTDLDNNLTTVYVYDDAGRVLSVVESTGSTGIRGTWTIYDDASRTVTVDGDLKTYGDGLLWTRTHYDQLGRVKLTQQSDGTALVDNNSGIKVQTSESYPLGGRMVITSKPYRSLSDATLEWNCTQYDTLGRIERVSTFKGSAKPANCETTTNRTGTTVMGYDLEWTTITDPAENVRKQKVDVLGRLVEVVEDPGIPPVNLNYVTTYAYDALDNLTLVTQIQASPPATQYRTFTYSSLSRLLSATNPESGTTSYTYHDSGDLATKKDARNITSTLTYDVLHRVKTKIYSDTTPDVTYTYHMTSNGSVAPNIGQLKLVSSSAATTTYDSYGLLGQVTASSQDISVTGAKLFTYEWYLNGALKKLKYPSGKEVNYLLDDAGRAELAYSGSTDYADMTAAAVGANAYAPDGRIAKVKLGNGLYETRDYNTPGTATSYRLGSYLNGGNLTQVEYDFLASTNNGNVQAQRVLRPGASSAWQQTYGYDGVNRLSTASESANGGTGWSRTYSYDQYGNRWVTKSTNISNTGEPTSQSAFTASDNHLSGASYDLAGNQTAYNGMTFTYDAEGRNTTVSGSASATYSYDGEGRRVKKVSGGVTTYYVYNALGQLSVEYSTDNPVTTGVSYLFTDMLGSVRTITNASGNVTECYDYLPFGRILGSGDNGRSAAGCHLTVPTNVANSVVSEKFTGQPRDAETGLDYFGARYFSAGLGRFTSPDPLYIEARRLADPQQLNLYSYVRNNPLKFRDPTGMYIDFDCDTDDSCEEALRMFNSRDGGQFTVGFGDNNRLQILGDINRKKLGKAEKALYDAITDTKQGGVLQVWGDTGQAYFGAYEGKGVNSVDLGNLSKLDMPSNSGGVSSGDVVAHEVLESYFSLSTKGFDKAHKKVLKSGLPGLISNDLSPYVDANATTAIRTYGFSDNRGSMRSNLLITPIPKESILGYELPNGNRVSIRVNEVEFVPKE